MVVESKEDRGIQVLTVGGDSLDASNANTFKTSVAERLGAGRHVIDMTSLRFVDSSGIGALLSSLRRVNAEGGELKLAGLQPNVASLFKLVRMDRLFDIHETAKEAVESYAA